METLVPILPILILGFIQSILTGISGAPSVIAAMIASRAIGVYRALFLSTLAQFVGPFLLGAAAATVIGAEVVNIQHIPPIALYSGLIATIVWMLLAFMLRIPSSSTHAVLGGLIGATVTASGFSAIQPTGLLKVVLSLLLSAPIGFVGGFVMMRVTRWFAIAIHATPRINRRFNEAQWFTSFGLGVALGSINAQAMMGMITLGLVLAGFLPHFTVPLWVIAVCAAGLAIGNLAGGLRLIKSVGSRFFQIRPIHAFSAEIAAALIVASSSLVGSNVSATHVTNFSIVGAGAAERMSMVRWGFVKNVFVTWILTIPMTALMAGVVYFILSELRVK